MALAMEERLDHVERKMKISFSEIFASIPKKFDTFTIMPEIEDPKRDRLRKQVEIYVGEARETFHKVIRHGLAEAKTAGARIKMET